MLLVGGVVINLIVHHVHYPQDMIQIEKDLPLWESFVHGVVQKVIHLV